MPPRDTAIRPYYECSRGSNVVVQKIVNPVTLGHVLCRVREYGVLGPYQIRHLKGVSPVVHADGDELYVAFLELRISLRQLYKLAPTDTSEEAPVKDQRQAVTPFEQLGQGHHPAPRLGELE